MVRYGIAARKEIVPEKSSQIRYGLRYRIGLVLKLKIDVLGSFLSLVRNDIFISMTDILDHILRSSACFGGKLTRFPIKLSKILC